MEWVLLEQLIQLLNITYQLGIYLLNAIGLSPGGSSTVHIYTQNNTQNDTKQTIHRTTQQFGRVRAVPRLG